MIARVLLEVDARRALKIVVLDQHIRETVNVEKATALLTAHVRVESKAGGIADGKVHCVVAVGCVDERTARANI